MDGVFKIILGTIGIVIVASVVTTQNAATVGGTLQYYILTLVTLFMTLGLLYSAYKDFFSKG